MLLDHFHSPLKDRRAWESFHSAWAVNIAVGLNRILPDGYVAEPNAQFGIEIDVAGVSEPREPRDIRETRAVYEYTPPNPTQSLSIPVLTDCIEVQIHYTEGGPILEAAVELVSPANKDGPAHRHAFVSKCAALVQQGIGLVIVDVVSDRRANLHEELLSRLCAEARIPLGAPLYCAAYRTVIRNEQAVVDMWQYDLALGRPLPAPPLFLKGGVSVPVDLDAAYLRACDGLRIEA